MSRNSIKATVTAVWVPAVCATGMAGNFHSLSGWTLMMGLAVTPLVMMWQWDELRLGTSERTQKGLR